MMFSGKKIQYLLIVISVISFLGVIGYCLERDSKMNATEDASSVQIKTYFDNIYLVGNVDSTQKIKLFEMEENSYYAFIPSEMRTDVYVQFEGFKELQIGDVFYRNGDELSDIYKGEPYIISLWDDKGNVLETATLKFSFAVDTPTIYIESFSGSMDGVNNDKTVKEKVKFSSIYADGTKDVSEQCSIKTRGNTAFTVKQKSYSLNFQSNQSVFGISPCSEYALLANYGNTTQQLRNKLVLDLAEMLDMPYTPEAKFVNVYIDNQYNGLYLLSQKISADGGSVEFEKDKNGGGQSEKSYLLEFDARYEEEPVWFKTRNQNVVVKHPKVIQKNEAEFIISYVKEVENAIYSGKENTYKAYIDLETWTSMYLLQEFFTQWDVEFASFYFYKKSEDPLLYAGPVWDFDLSCGLLYPGYYPILTQNTFWLKDNRGGWLGELGNYEEFQEILREKYLHEFTESLNSYLENTFETLVDHVSSSSYMNSKRWGRGDTKIKDEATEIREWIINRKEFLDEYIENKDMFVKLNFQFGWGTVSHYVKKGEKLGFLPTKEYGEVDYLENKDYGYGKIVAWQDINGEPISADMIINEATTFLAIYNQ